MRKEYRFDYSKARPNRFAMRKGERLIVANYYLAKPKSGKGKGVLVLHAWWGLNPFVKKFCDRLAKEGFIALAPDLYHGAVASTIAEAKKLRDTHKPKIVGQEIAQAAAQLRALCGGNKRTIGVVGFSLGGYWALWFAEQKTSAVAATVAFYASRNGDYRDSPSAFQFHLAERDDYVAASGVKKLAKQLSAAGKDAEFFTYPGTSHWFFENDRVGAYNARAAKLAWGRTIKFLKTHI
jgi:carboxymethylenebutenolidase